MAGDVAVFGDNFTDDFINTIGHTATLVTDIQLATPGFIDSFDAFYYTRNGAGIGSTLSPAAAANVKAFVTGNILLFNADAADALNSDPDLQTLTKNAVDFAVSLGGGYIGEYTGTAAALTSNANGLEPLDLVSGAAGGLGSSSSFNTDWQLTAAGIGHPVTSGVSFPTDPDDTAFAAPITGIDSALVLATYSDRALTPVIIAVTVPEPTTIALALAGLCLPLRRRFRHRVAGFRTVRASGSLLSACLVACFLTQGTSSSDVNAAVITQLFSPGAMTSPTLLNDFESVKDNTHVTFNATATLITALAATEGVTPSGLRGLSEEDDNEPLTAMLASTAREVGVWFGNDDFGLSFDAVLEVLAGGSSLGSVSLPSNANDYADQFIALRSDMAFDEVRIGYERPAARGLSIYIDDFYVGVPEPASCVTLIAGLPPLGVLGRARRKCSK